jgi:hypothetical protein
MGPGNVHLWQIPSDSDAPSWGNTVLEGSIPSLLQTSSALEVDTGPQQVCADHQLQVHKVASVCCNSRIYKAN